MGSQVAVLGSQDMALVYFKEHRFGFTGLQRGHCYCVRALHPAMNHELQNKSMSVSTGKDKGNIGSPYPSIFHVL